MLPLRPALSLAWALLPLVAGEAQEQPAPTFSKDIAPLVATHCAPCHRPGEGAPFSLLTYDEVKKHAGQIVTVTKSRFMPPWLPEPGYGSFEGERRLSDRQIELIRRWVDGARRKATGPRPADAPVRRRVAAWERPTWCWNCRRRTRCPRAASTSIGISSFRSRSRRRGT